MLENNLPPEDIAKYCLIYVGMSILSMAEEAVKKYGKLPMIFAGGVMSNKLIKNIILSKYDAFFAEPEFSCDNAAGVSVIAYEKYRRHH